MKRNGLLIGLVLGWLVAGLALAFEPGIYDITMQAGEDYVLTMNVKDSLGSPVDLTGYSYAAQMRTKPAPVGSVLANYSTTIVTPSAGLIRVKLSKEQTLANSGKAGTWDLRQTDPQGQVTYLLTGKCTVKPTTTR